jgi:2-polyprenyl-6-methoxyphenol hydroxylase-like FAD-dependent oxidoreductase
MMILSHLYKRRPSALPKLQGMTLPLHYDVAIAGAGPVGLFLACELALARCSVLILEREADPHSPLKQLPFGIRGLSSPSVDALYRRGLLERLEVSKRLTNPFAGAARKQAGHFAGIPFDHDRIDPAQWTWRVPGSPPASLLSDMAELEMVLAHRAADLGVEIRRGLPVTAVGQDDDGVTVHAGGQWFAARWLVGCDGARSVVRKAGGFSFEGTEPAFTGYSLKVDLADPEKLGAGRVVTPDGVYFQSQPGYLNLQDFDGGAFHGSGQPLTLSHAQTLLRRISGTGVTLNALHVGSTWTDRARQAASYRNGRILLAGDAAHIHAPLGGQGLNLGLGDAMNLGWKLAATVRAAGRTPSGLLDTYQAERHPVGAQVLDWSRAQVAIMRPDPEGGALRAIMRDLLSTADGATYIAGRVWGVTARYDLGDGHPLSGRSAPDFAFDDGGRLGELLRDGGAVLLDFSADETLRMTLNGTGGRVRYVARRAGARRAIGALLIRPDGIVAWAGDDGHQGEGLGAALARWFG